MNVPGYRAGTWTINPVNSELGFTVRHLGVARVHGRFRELAGEITTGGTAALSAVTATVAAGSVDTGFAGRDAYLRGDDVLAAAEHGELAFVSTGVRADGAGWAVDGELTVRGVTRPVTLAVEVGGFGDDPTGGGPVLGLSATAALSRRELGFAAAVPAAVIGDRIDLRLDVQAALAG